MIVGLGDTDLFTYIRDPVSRKTIFDLIPAFRLQYLSIAVIQYAFLEEIIHIFCEITIIIHGDTVFLSTELIFFRVGKIFF